MDRDRLSEGVCLDRLSREILEKIAEEFGYAPSDPKVLQIAYRLVWEMATGVPAEKASREPRGNVPRELDPALRTPDQEDLTELCNSILDDPIPKTSYLAPPSATAARAGTTEIWLKRMLADCGFAAKNVDRPGVVEGKKPEPATPVVKVTMIPAAAAPVRTVERVPVKPRMVKRSALRRPADWDKEAMTPETAAKSAPAWLLSLAAHLVIAVVLMNIVYFNSYGKAPAVFRLSIAQAEPVAEVVKPPPPPPDKPIDDDPGPVGEEGEDSPPAGDPDPSDPNPTGVKTPTDPEVAIAPPIAVGTGTPPLPGEGTSGNNGLGGVYAGRGGDGKRGAIRRNGGSDATEEAVAAGLAWLAKHQDLSGGWGTADSVTMCPDGDKCSTIITGAPRAISGLCLLAFVGAGHMHTDQESPYRDHVARAVKYLVRHQGQDGGFVEESRAFLYTHGIVTFALAELYAMTKDESLAKPVQLAVDYIARAQQANGGWDYSEDRTGRGDTSVSTYQVMALFSARAARLSVPKKTWEAAQGFYERIVNTASQSMCYDIDAANKVRPGTMAIGAAAVVARHYLGMRNMTGVESHLFKKILGNLPNPEPDIHNQTWENSFYYTYYGTLATFHKGGESWSRWNNAMKKALLARQVRKGHTDGSWEPIGADGGSMGRTYCTAMSVMNLEIYYRFLPSYSSDSLAPLADVVRPPKDAPKKEDEPQATVGELITQLSDLDMLSRRHACRELCRRKAAEAVPALLKAVKVEKTSALPLMIEDLAAFPAQNEILEAFVGFLNDPESRVRDAALRSLKKATGADRATAEEWRRWLDENR